MPTTTGQAWRRGLSLAAEDGARGVLLDEGAVAPHQRIDAGRAAITTRWIASTPRDDADLNHDRILLDKQGTAAITVARVFIVDSICVRTPRGGSVKSGLRVRGSRASAQLPAHRLESM